jgi:hypothetical protein
LLLAIGLSERQSGIADRLSNLDALRIYRVDAIRA